VGNARAVRYRRLALAEADTAKADLLHKLADESDRGLLCTAEWLSVRRSVGNEQPPKAGHPDICRYLTPGRLTTDRRL
jgi:hypothetical protein